MRPNRSRQYTAPTLDSFAVPIQYAPPCKWTISRSSSHALSSVGIGAPVAATKKPDIRAGLMLCSCIARLSSPRISPAVSGVAGSSRSAGSIQTNLLLRHTGSFSDGEPANNICVLQIYTVQRLVIDTSMAFVHDHDRRGRLARGIFINALNGK